MHPRTIPPCSSGLVTASDSRDLPARRVRRAVVSDRPALSAELALQRESGAAAVRAQADLFRDRVDGVQVQDNPLAWVHMSPLAASALLLGEGVDPVPI